MPYFVLFYDVVEGFPERRTPFRPEHLNLVNEAHARGELLLAGALADPTDGALLVFRADDRRVAEEFARRDPYVLNGLVMRWRVRGWNVVTESQAPAGNPSR
jgi:hypothetical protein